MAAKAPMIVTGTVVAGTSTARQSWRKTQDHDQHEHAGLEQGLVDFVDRLLDEDGGVEGDRVFDARRGTSA